MSELRRRIRFPRHKFPTAGRRLKNEQSSSQNQGQNGSIGGNSTEQFAKKWNTKFSKRQNLNELEASLNADADGNSIDILLQNCDDSIASREIKELCQGVSLGDSSSEPCPGGAWVDDRNCDRSINDTGIREYTNPLTPTQLFELLKAKVPARSYG